MRQYFAYWLPGIKWAYWRWEGREPIMMSIISYLVSIGGGIGAAFAKLWWISLIPLGILILFVAPYKVWRKLSDEFEKITKKRLEISLTTPVLRQYKDDIKGEWSQEWYKLQVHNPTALPITDCYGKLVRFTSKLPWPDSPYMNMPTPGIMFPWSSYSARGKLATIGSHDFDSLDVLVFDGEILSVVVLDDASGKRDLTQFNLLPDEYELVIQLGSQSEAFPPSDVILKVESYVEKGKEHIRVTIPNQDVDYFTKLE
jgi:hypothetical protein